MLRLSILLLVSTFAVSCVSVKSGSDLLKCEGGDVRATLSQVSSTNAESATYQSPKVISTLSTGQGFGLVMASSLCPIPLGSDRTLTVSLNERPTVGKTYTMGNPGTGSSYVEYAELTHTTPGALTIQTWVATGTLTVSAISGSTITVSGRELTMSPRLTKANDAQGSFRMELAMRADNVPGF